MIGHYLVVVGNDLEVWLDERSKEVLDASHDVLDKLADGLHDALHILVIRGYVEHQQKSFKKLPHVSQYAHNDMVLCIVICRSQILYYQRELVQVFCNS